MSKKFEIRLHPISRCGSCDSLLFTGKYGSAVCNRTGRKISKQKYMNEGFPKDCSLKKG